MIVEQTRMNIKSTMQSILESQSKVTVNEEQKELIGKTIEDLTSQKLTNAKETESWYLSRSIEMETHKLNKEAEKNHERNRRVGNRQ